MAWNAERFKVASSGPRFQTVPLPGAESYQIDVAADTVYAGQFVPTDGGESQQPSRDSRVYKIGYRDPDELYCSVARVAHETQVWVFVFQMAFSGEIEHLLQPRAQGCRGQLRRDPPD
jgi:hypothetical protein